MDIPRTTTDLVVACCNEVDAPAHPRFDAVAAAGCLAVVSAFQPAFELRDIRTPYLARRLAEGFAAAIERMGQAVSVETLLGAGDDLVRDMVTRRRGLGLAIAAYLPKERVIVRYGRVGVRVDDLPHPPDVSSLEPIAARRAEALERMLAEGASVEDLLDDDPTRDRTMMLEHVALGLANEPGASGIGGYGLLDGRGVHEEYMEVIPLTVGQRLALTSLGYPFPGTSHLESERALERTLSLDPLRIIRGCRDLTGARPGLGDFGPRAFAGTQVA
ncbi:hypothetical protein [Miltoncostaea oceani]|uniref:hypothetical protein n=1 Tax=Miltoncostaea oceani TaxID=2843216 RepID=UPI001C3DB380|nr:hypothetical protein [Miltoncostaea oceani]